MSTSTVTYDFSLSNITRDLADDCLTDLAKLLKRHVDWQAACAAYSTLGLKTATDGRRPPSKNSKHQMYSQAIRLHQLLDLPTPRPSTLADIDQLVREARIILGITR